MSRSIISTFSPTCPAVSKWYACPRTSASKFIGCCMSDPCGSQGCPLGKLQAVSFNASAYGTYPDITTCSSGSMFLSCVDMPANKTTFWGCCKSNACNTGAKCPQADLVPASLDSDLQFEAYGAAPASTASAPASAAVSGSTASMHTGTIAGIAVGGAVAIVAIVSILIFCICKRRRSKSGRTSVAEDAGISAPLDGKAEHRESSLSDAPPSYKSPNPGHAPFAKYAHSLSPATAFSLDEGSGGGHVYLPVPQMAQELSADSATPITSPQTSPARQHSRFSELPAGQGGTAAPSHGRFVEMDATRHHAAHANSNPRFGAHAATPAVEMDSPVPSRKAVEMESPMPSPRLGGQQRRTREV